MTAHGLASTPDPSAKVPSAFGFYAILTNPRVGYERLTELLVRYEVSFVQLRMKDAPEPDVLRMAQSLRRLTSGTGTRLIVNDFPFVAAEAGADGVHVGQDDMPYEQVRRIVGPHAIVGISTHSPEQARAACAQSPDYIGVGPVYATPTKKTPDAPLGIPGMQKMLGVATVPAVVLGSITARNLPDILAAGAKNFSLVRPLNDTEEPEKALQEILSVSGRRAGQ